MVIACMCVCDASVCKMIAYLVQLALTSYSLLSFFLLSSRVLSLLVKVKSHLRFKEFEESTRVKHFFFLLKN